MGKKAFVVIDIQNDITKHYRDVIGNINAAVDWAAGLGMPLVYIKHNNLTPGSRTFRPGAKGAEFVPELKVVSDNIFVKTKANALTSEKFSEIIRENGIDEFYITGADATACVKSTCFNMAKAGYTVHVLSDCVTSYDPEKMDEMLGYYAEKGCEVKTLAAFQEALSDRAEQDNQTLIGFWDKALSLSEEDREELRGLDPESWKDLAPSEKLFEAACSLGKRRKVLDYGCGSAWAGIIAAKSGCPDVTAADAAPGAVRAAECYASVYDVGRQLCAVCAGPGWLGSVPAGTYDAFFCSNVLDVIPEETAEEILRESARITAPDASVIIGLNFFLSPEAAAGRGMELADGRRLYVDNVLRLVSRTDEEWAEVFSPWYTVEKLDHFAWPGEKTETRRLFWLKKRENKR